MICPSPRSESEEIEKYVLAALQMAAASYTRARGRFLPYAEAEIKQAIRSYRKARVSAQGVKHLEGANGGWPPHYDMAAWRRGMLARGVLL